MEDELISPDFDMGTPKTSKVKDRWQSDPEDSDADSSESNINEQDNDTVDTEDEANIGIQAQLKRLLDVNEP